MRTTIIYHQVRRGIDCPDGFAAAFICSLEYPDAQIIGCVYGDPIPPEINDGDRLIIVDFSFPKADLETLADRGCTVTVLDHHKTAWENLQDLSLRISSQFNMDECGATMAWQYFFPNEPMPAFLAYVRDRDLWEKKLPRTEELNAAFGKIGRSFDLYRMIQPLSAEELQNVFGKFGSKLLAEKALLVESIAARAQVIQIDEYAVPGVYLTEAEGYLTSDICERLYTVLFPSDPFVCCITFEGTYSLRSSKASNFDVSEVAKRHSGGGHRNASGFLLVNYNDCRIKKAIPKTD